MEPDQYTVVREGDRLRIGHRRLGAKATVIRAAPEGGTWVFEKEHADRQALPDPVILRLAEWGERIQDLFGTPQDKGCLYVSPRRM